MRLERYFGRIQDVLYARGGIEVELLTVHEIVPDQEIVIHGRLRFWDHSLLEFVEHLVERQLMAVKTNYVYHYQAADNQLIFRYDNTPHHPEISSHPHHKHTDTNIQAANPPHLNDVLREINTRLYPAE